MRHMLVLLLALGFISSAYGADRAEALRQYREGLRHEFSRDYRAARESFEASLQTARVAGLDQQFVSAVIYNLARMVGYTCDFSRANVLLLEALQLEEAVPKPDPGNITKRVSELARLSFDRGQFADSVAYYKRVIPELERLGVVAMDPVGYASFLDDYASALNRAGNDESLQDVRRKAITLRNQHAGKRAQFQPVHYRDVCPPRS